MQVAFLGFNFLGTRKYCKLLLALFVTFGLALGVYFALAANDEIFLLVRTVPLYSVSIVGSFAVIALPFFFFYFIVSFGRSWMLLPVCFLKAFCWSYCSCLVAFAFGSAGWLVHLLFMFSDTVLLPFFFYFSCRYISGEKILEQSDLWIYIIISIVVGIVDFCYISPFLAMII